MTAVNDILASADSDFVMFTTQVCPYCNRAKNFLNAKNLTYEEFDVSKAPEVQI